MNDTTGFPYPEPEPETDGYWAAANNGRLLLRHCLSCGQVHYYPRGHCPFCHATDLEDRESLGAGAIYSFSIIRIGPAAPYALAYVTLDEGVSVLTDIVESDLDTLAIGDRVELAFAGRKGDSHEVKVPVWRKLRAAKCT